jgi:hypothetical protein
VNESRPSWGKKSSEESITIGKELISNNIKTQSRSRIHTNLLELFSAPPCVPTGGGEKQVMRRNQSRSGRSTGMVMVVYHYEAEC